VESTSPVDLEATLVVHDDVRVDDLGLPASLRLLLRFARQRLGVTPQRLSPIHSPALRSA
jgi:hypothetical protein